MTALTDRPCDGAADADAPTYPYRGPDALREPLRRALSSVVDPEFALDIVDLGLVRDVDVDAHRAHVRLTMTTATCPVADLIVRDVEDALDRALPDDRRLLVELVWTPPWSPADLSPRARAFLQGGFPA